MEFTRFVDLIFGTSVHNYRRLSSIWWRLSAGWVLSHRFALRSRPALAVLKSDQDQEMGVGLGGHGRGWVRAASAGRQLRRDQSWKVRDRITFLRSCIAVDKAGLKESIIMSGYFSASTNWQGVSHNEPLSWTSSASRVYAGKRLLKWRNPIRSVTWRLWQVTHGLTIWFGKDCETIWLMMVFCAENILAARRTTLLDGESHPIPDVLFSSVYKQRRLIKPNPSPPTSQLHCILFTWKIAGDGVGPEAPQFAQTSLKYLHLDHPLRRACIRSTFLFFFPFHRPLTLHCQDPLESLFWAADDDRDHDQLRYLGDVPALRRFRILRQEMSDTEGETENFKNFWRIRDVIQYLSGVENNVTKVIDDVIYLYFLGEMIIKMIAMGVMGRGCYLQVLHFVISTIIACHYILE